MKNPEFNMPEVAKQEGEQESKERYPLPKFMKISGEVNASHKSTEEIPYEDGELVIIDSEDANYYYGRGHLGLGGNLINQKFPKQGLRELNTQELEDLASQKFNNPGVGESQYILSPDGEIEEIKAISE